jgi:phage gpG-like protein
MARSKAAFNLSDLKAKLDKRIVIKSQTQTSGLLAVNLTKFPATEIINRFEAAIDRANNKIAFDLKKALDDAIRSGVWQGTDIFETGSLMESGTVIVGANGVTVSYDAPYAAIVHYGGYINPYGDVNRRIYLPPRPWLESVMLGGGPVAQFNFVDYYLREIEQEFD